MDIYYLRRRIWKVQWSDLQYIVLVLYHSLYLSLPFWNEILWLYIKVYFLSNIKQWWFKSSPLNIALKINDANNKVFHMMQTKYLILYGNIVYYCMMPWFGTSFFRVATKIFMCKCRTLTGLFREFFYFFPGLFWKKMRQFWPNLRKMFIYY